MFGGNTLNVPLVCEAAEFQHGRYADYIAKYRVWSLWHGRFIIADYPDKRAKTVYYINLNTKALDYILEKWYSKKSLEFYKQLFSEAELV